MDLPLTYSRIHVYGHPDEPSSSSQADARLGRARLLLDHLRRDWPAMDVVLSSTGSNSKGKHRAWGERFGEVEPGAEGSAATPISRVNGEQPPRLTRQKRRKNRQDALDTTRFLTGLGRCFQVVAPPHSSHTSHYNLPDPTLLALNIPPFSLPPASSSGPAFCPPKPGRQRGKWIVPVHGPVLGCPTASGGWLATDVQEVEDAQAYIEGGFRSERKSKAQRDKAARETGRSAELAPLKETTRSNSQQYLLSGRIAPPKVPSTATAPATGQSTPTCALDPVPPPPPPLLWTPTLLRSLHKALLGLVSNHRLGPVSIVLHHATDGYPKTETNDPSANQGVGYGDHYRIYIDLAYALNVRYLLETLDLRLESQGRDGRKPKRVRLLAGAKLALVGDVGDVLLVA